MADIPELSANIHKTSTVLGRLADTTLLDSCGYGISQFKIIWILHNHPEGVLQTNIATWLSQTEAAVSRQIGILKSEGLITKRVEAKNRRNHIITLSADGKTFAKNAMKILTNAYRPCFATLSQSEQETLNELLKKLFFSVVKHTYQEGK